MNDKTSLKGCIRASAIADMITFINDLAGDGPAHDDISLEAGQVLTVLSEAFGPECESRPLMLDALKCLDISAAPKVKALEWMPDRDGRGFIAVTSVGQFAVFDEGCPRWAFSGRYNSGYRYFKKDTLEDAKAAAQSHYESLILSALVL